MRYILREVVLLEACDVTNNGRHLGFYQELEIRLKSRYSQLSLNGHLYKMHTSVKRTPRAGPCLSLLLLFDSKSVISLRWTLSTGPKGVRLRKSCL